ncbi:P-loop containing nucleoside triphosphate hydrolase protein [Apiospora kogelbergensis]|uniref:P-loop containing nucleoside triphosphate hydrolase protein n=1 Tax=Apiospora kogelbergensis TaxID=1337665 RepID=A0AAW0QPP5_9PEZI
METTRDVFDTMCGDGSLGPSVKSPECRGGGFDLTLLFEESILTILPAALFIVLAAIRSFTLVGKRPAVRRHLLYYCKLVAIIVYTGLQAVLLALAAQTSLRTKATLASATLSLVTGLSLAALSHLEHAKSIRPSFIINTYLIATIIFDIARVRTQWLSQRNGNAIASVLTASLTFKCVLVVLESLEKQSLLLEPEHRYSLESTSGVVSRSWFWWLTSLLFAGFRKVLSLEDLPTIHEKINSDRLSHRIEATWENWNQKGKHALALACIWSLRWEILMTLIPKFLGVGLMISQTFLIQDAVHYIQSDPSDGNNDGYGLIGAFGLVYISLAITTGWYSHLTIRTMSMMRGELVSLIYLKTTTLPITSVSESAATTLMSTDAQRISETFQLLLMDLLPLLAQLGLSVYVLYSQLGAVCVTPIIVAIISVSLSTVLASRIGPRQKNWLEATQKRINYTTEILGAMRNVKMLGLAKQMEYNIQNMREREMAVSRRYRRLHALNIGLVNMPSIFAGLSLFATYAVVARIDGTEGMSVSQAITSLAAMMVLAQPLIMILYAIPHGWSALGCFARIQEFLNEESHVDSRSRLSMDTPPDSPKEKETLQRITRVSSGSHPHESYIRVQKASFAWSSSDNAVVKGLETHIGPGCNLTIIVGPVGCGKSTLLKGLLSETSKTDGVVSVCSPEIAYCDQTAWVINGSIRDNIVGNSEFDESWYRSTIQATALDVDLQQLPNGDSTVVGSKGIRLSGGQKARVSIARAIYARKSVAVLDDVLSGLDAVTEEHVFRKVFGRDGLFRRSGTTVILATHSIKRLPEANLILVLNDNGEIVEQGTFHELNIPGSYIHTLQVQLQKEEQESEDIAETDIESIDEKNKGIIEVEEKSEAEADESRQVGDWAIYRYYGRALGPMALFIWIIFLGSGQTFVGLGQVWINWWAEENDNGGRERTGYWLGIYAMFNSLEAILTMIAVGSYHNPDSSTHRLTSCQSPSTHILRDRNRSLGQSQKHLHSQHPRFSQDIRLADMTLPQSVVNIVFHSMGMLVIGAMTINAVPYIAVVFPLSLWFSTSFSASICVHLGSCDYLSIIEANAPLFSHFIESLNGLITIRSYGWVGAYVAKNMKLLDQSQIPSYHLQCIQRWLVFVLDMIVAGLVIITVGLAVGLRTKVNPGYLGIALIQLMTLSHELTGIVQSWTMLETSIGAITRIKDFAEKTPDESAPEETDAPTADWPSRGVLKFENVFATYGNGKPAVLKDVSFTIQAGEKVGIVGRTGSGKSSTTLAILRMIDIEAGKLTLDDVDLTTIKGSVVRERIICLTQEAFIYPGSIRANIDSLSQVTDDDIASALQKVGLWTVLQAKAAAAAIAKDKDNKEQNKNTTTTAVTTYSHSPSEILDTAMDTDFLSHGQRQLFCLARALLKSSSKVLILDEPTSSVDNQTDAQMQQVIREEFREHTVVMIAHRLSSLIDFDKVAVLDNGRLVEFGAPAELLENASGHFARLYHKSSSK